MTRVAIATTVEQIARPGCDGERSLAFWAYGHIANACHVLAVNVEREIGTNHRATVACLVTHDDKRSAQNERLNNIWRCMKVICGLHIPESNF